MSTVQLERYLRAGLTPRALRLVVALDDVRHVGRVAAFLHVTQPAVSKALGELERGLGLRLFERTTLGLRPTAFGACLVRHARAMLAGLGHASEELRGLAEGASGMTRIGVLAPLAASLVPDALARLKVQSSATTVFVREGSSDVLLAELGAGRIDLFVGNLPFKTEGLALEEKELFEERICLVVRAGHPLAARRRTGWHDLAAFPWVVPPSDSLLREPLFRLLDQNEVHPLANRIETLSIHVILGYVLRTEAIACLSFQAAEPYRREKLLEILPIELPRLLRPVGMAWRADRPQTPVTRMLMRILEDVAVASRAGTGGRRADRSKSISRSETRAHVKN